MFNIPTWLWGGLGGLILGPIGLLILWPGCARGAQALMQRFVISVVLKLFIAAIGFWLTIKYLHFEPAPLIWGFLVGYFISLFVEIIPCIWKLRQCTINSSMAD